VDQGSRLLAGARAGALATRRAHRASRGHTESVAHRLRGHDVVLVDGPLVLRPLTEDDWDIVAAWNTDPRVLWFSDNGAVEERSIADVQAIYREVSHDAEMFVIEHEGVAVGDGWVQQMNLARITTAFPDQRLARVDLQLAHDVWGRGMGTRAIRLLTARAFDRGDDLVFAVDVADFNHRSRRAFLRCGFVPWRRVPSPPGAKTALVHDLVCRPALFRGTVSAEAHPGKDRIRAGEAPFGAAVVVYRRAPAIEVLVLHRTGAATKGDWAWTPPGGARFPAEPVEQCAARELHEEVGLDLEPRAVTALDEAGWAVYAVEVAAQTSVALDEEHDRFEWVCPGEAIARCTPRVVGATIAAAVAAVE